MRVGFGEFEKKGSEYSVHILRSEFLKQVERLAPRVVADLEEGPLLIYKELYPKKNLVLLDVRLAEKVCKLYTALSHWSKEWNLDAEWICQAALGAINDCLSRRQHDPDYPLFLDYGDVQPDEAELEMYHNGISPPPALVDLSEWIVVYQTREEYLDDVRDIVNKRFKSTEMFSLGEPSLRNAFISSILGEAEAYCDRVEQYFKAQSGWKQINDRPELLKHIEWAVQFQILEREAHEIAKLQHKKRYGRGRPDPQEANTISKQAKKLLKSIGLEPREAAKGRPVMASGNDSDAH